MLGNSKVMFSIKNYSMYIIFFIVFSPIFLSLDFSHGLKFDAFLTQIKYLKPSVSISIFFIFISSLIMCRHLLKQRGILILFILTTIYTIINYYYGLSRAIILYGGMFLPLLSYYIFKNLIKNQYDVYNKMYVILIFIIAIKFLSVTLVYIFYYIDPIEITSWKYYTNVNQLSFFIHYSIRIYNYHDYFPFIYYTATVLSIYNIINKKMLVFSVLTIIASNLLIIDTVSRLFIYSIYLIPILLLFYYFTKLKLNTYFYLFIGTSIIITILTGIIDFKIEDMSLVTRYNHNHNYIDNFTLFNFIAPFINQHRFEAAASMHNELLEIFSFFGLLTFYYYFLIKELFIKVNKKYNIISYLLMYVILIGSLIQINITNPYVGIMLGMILAVISIQDTKNNKADINVQK